MEIEGRKLDYNIYKNQHKLYNLLDKIHFKSIATDNQQTRKRRLQELDSKKSNQTKMKNNYQHQTIDIIISN